MSFDISSLAIADSTILHLEHPATGNKLYADEDGAETLPVTITVASTASRAYRSAVSAMHNRTLKRGKKQLTAEQQKEEGIELLVSCCVASTNLPYHGNPVKTEADFRELLSDDSLSWIKQQVDACLGDTEAFIQA